MGRRTPRRGHNLPATRGHGGRPTKLTPRTEDAILHAVLQGNHLTTAAASAGISAATLHKWVERGNDVEEAIQSGKPYAEEEVRYLEFRDRLADARAQAEMEMVSIVRKVAIGGYLTHERPLQDLQGDALYDREGNLLVERTYAQPDGRIALSYLARSRPQQWGQSAAGRVEIVGSQGGPVQVEHTTGDVISKLTERLHSVIAQQRDDDEPIDVHEADVVETSGDEGE